MGLFLVRVPPIAAVVALAFGLSSPAAALPLIRLAEADMPAKTPSIASPDTARFVKEAALSDQFEIATAKVAEQRSSNPDVKDFAQLMIKDHTAINNDLKAAIWQANIHVAVPSALDDKHAQMLRGLTQAKVADFDRLYMRQQILAQDDTARVHLFYGDNGDNRYLREFANDSGPTVEAHLALARHLSLSVGAMQASP